MNTDFILEKFKFEEDFKIPPVKNINAEAVIDIYEGMRDFFPSYQISLEPTTIAPKLDNILDHFDALLLDAFGVINVGPELVPGIISTLDKARNKGITLLVVTNGASNNSFKKLSQLSSLGLEFSDNEIISSRDVAEIFLTLNKPEGPMGILGNIGNSFEIPNLHCVELQQDYSMFNEMKSFVFLGTLHWDPLWQEILFNSLKDYPRPLFVANPDLVAPHQNKFSIEPAYYVSILIKNGVHLPFWFGKPFSTIFEIAVNRINELSGRYVPLSRIGMVGDTLHTDILGANSFGLKSILMTKYGLLRDSNIGEMIKKTNIIPDYIVEGP